MSNYQRSTRECSFEELRPEFQQAFLEYLKVHELGDLDPASYLCCETVSTLKKVSGLPAWLNGEQEAVFCTAILLGPENLVWARAGGSQTQAAQVHGTSLSLLKVKEVTSIMTLDTGLEIYGLMIDTKKVARGSIYLGEDPAAKKFYEATIRAVAKANPKPVWKLPRWLGGG